VAAAVSRVTRGRRQEAMNNTPAFSDFIGGNAVFIVVVIPLLTLGLRGQSL